MMRAAAIVAACIASFLSEYALCLRAGALFEPAILAAILALVIGQRPARLDRRYLLAVPLIVAFTALAASAVGRLLLTLPVAGAIVFTLAMFLSIWLRNFGDRGRAAGGLIAMPLVAMLIVPARTAAPGGPLVDLALIVSAGIIPFVYVTAVQLIARRAGLAIFPIEAPPPPERRERAGVPVATRMALQMAVGLTAAFAAGFLLFPAHWGWAVLTAYIVAAGARGRGDALYKGVLRLVGASAGTIVAALLAHVAFPGGAPEAIAIFALLFAALALREINYAYWAGFITLILALLSSSATGFNIGMLAERLAAILAGALCAAAAAWFVYPIRTEAVIRRRLADALAALDDFVVHGHVSEDERKSRLATFESRMNELHAVAPPVEWHRRVFARDAGPNHPAHWIDTARNITHHARALGADENFDERQRGRLRRAIGTSRRAIAEHGAPDASTSVSDALAGVHDLLGAPKTRS